MKTYLLDGNVIDGLGDFGYCAQLMAIEQRSLTRDELAYFSQPDRGQDGDCAHYDRITDWLSELSMNEPAVLRVNGAARLREVLGFQHAVDELREQIRLISRKPPSLDRENGLKYRGAELAALTDAGGPGTFDAFLSIISKGSRTHYEHPLAVVLDGDLEVAVDFRSALIGGPDNSPHYAKTAKDVFDEFRGALIGATGVYDDSIAAIQHDLANLASRSALVRNALASGALKEVRIRVAGMDVLEKPLRDRLAAVLSAAPANLAPDTPFKLSVRQV